METHKIFSGLAGWVLLVGFCIYAWAISLKPTPAISHSQKVAQTELVKPVSEKQKPDKNNQKQGKTENQNLKILALTSRK